MIIERALLSDSGEILELQKRAYISEALIYNDFTIPPLLQTLEEIRLEFADRVFLKASLDKRIIGSVRAFAENGTCNIGRLIVHPDFQNQGIGSKLLKEIESFFDGCRRFELFTGQKSTKNLYLYQKHGYQIFKTEKVTADLNLVYLEKLAGENSNPVLESEKFEYKT